MQASPVHVMHRSGRGPKMVSQKPAGQNRVAHNVKASSLKLPVLNDVTDVSDKGIDGQTTARVNISNLSQNEALSLLDQYNKIVSDESGRRQPELPHIKVNIRQDTNRSVPVRDRFTTKSLERVERTKSVFTEGLSSKSKFQEPSLAMHRRDIIGANMPETVRLARERSNIVFGLNRYKPRKQLHNVTGQRGKNFKGIWLEPASVTASQITAPLGVPQKVDLRNAWEENEQKNESRIARMLKTIEDRYGRDMIGPAEPSTPSVHSTDYILSTSTLTSAITPVTTPRKSPLLAEKPVKPNLSVVSLGQSLAELPQKLRPTVKIQKPTRDNSYNQLQRFKQHVQDKRLSRVEMRYSTRREHKPRLHHPVISEFRTHLANRGNKASVKKKQQIVVYLKDLTGDAGLSEDVASAVKEGELKQEGKFNLEGVKGVATYPRSWSPLSISTSASVTNPPPSVEVGLYDLEFPNVNDPAAIFTVAEEQGKEDNSHLTAELDGHLSDGNASLVSSTHLSVPSLSPRQQYPQNMETVWRERPPQKDYPLTGIESVPFDKTKQLSPRGPETAAEIKVTTLELFPGGSDSHVGPAISISGSDEVEADLQKHRDEQKLREECVDQNRNDEGIEDNSEAVIEQTVHRGSIPSQTIAFTSPLEKQGRAKRH